MAGCDVCRNPHRHWSGDKKAARVAGVDTRSTADKLRAWRQVAAIMLGITHPRLCLPKRSSSMVSVDLASLP